MNIKRLTWLIALLTVAICTVSAEEAKSQEKKEKTTIEVPAWVKNIKVSGYGMLQYQAEDSKKPDAKHNEFNLRLARLIFDGKIGDFDWRVQLQGTSNAGPGNPTVMLVDLYTEWAKYKEFRVKAGQFKRAFTFENPTHPITQGWYSYGMVVNNLSGFGDRTGEKSSGGRDIGLQVQGDLFPNSDGRRLLHYQVGIYNGEGINQKDMDQRKDIIGGLWVMPIAGVRIGLFGWTGSRGKMIYDYATVHTGKYLLDAENNKIEQIEKKGLTCSMSKNRYAISAEYDKDEWTFRAEYIHSQGWGAAKAGNNVREIDYSKGDKADGFYCFGIVPVIKSKLHAKARYNLYRPQKEWNTSKTMYEVGLNYYINKHIQINAEYARVNERVPHVSSYNYNFADIELDFRF